MGIDAKIENDRFKQRDVRILKGPKRQYTIGGIMAKKLLRKLGKGLKKAAPLIALGLGAAALGKRARANAMRNSMTADMPRSMVPISKRMVKGLTFLQTQIIQLELMKQQLEVVLMIKMITTKKVAEQVLEKLKEVLAEHLNGENSYGKSNKR